MKKLERRANQFIAQINSGITEDLSVTRIASTKHTHLSEFATCIALTVFFHWRKIATCKVPKSRVEKILLMLLTSKKSLFIELPNCGNTRKRTNSHHFLIFVPSLTLYYSQSTAAITDSLLFNWRIEVQAKHRWLLLFHCVRRQSHILGHWWSEDAMCYG